MRLTHTCPLPFYLFTLSIILRLTPPYTKVYFVSAGYFMPRISLIPTGINSTVKTLRGFHNSPRIIGFHARVVILHAHRELVPVHREFRPRFLITTHRVFILRRFFRRIRGAILIAGRTVHKIINPVRILRVRHAVYIRRHTVAIRIPRTVQRIGL